MTDAPDSQDPKPGPAPLRTAVQGRGREGDAGEATVEAGVFIETTVSGRLARVVGAGEWILDEGFWLTDGQYRETRSDPEARAAASARQTQVLKARVDCLMSHSGGARLADLLSTLHGCLGRDRLTVTQQALADLLGRRRATINEGLQALQDRKIIRIGRGRIEVCDGAGLAGAACGCESRWLRGRSVA